MESKLETSLAYRKDGEEMKRTRIVSVLLMVSLLLGSMAGFSAAAAEETGPVSISFWHCNQGIDEVQDEMAVAYLEKTGNSCEVVSLESAAYKEKVAVAAASEELPDVFQQWAGGVLRSYVEAGVCMDLTELMTESGAVDFWTEAAIDMVTFDGKIYAMPGFDMMVWPMYYNTEILAGYGYADGAFPQTIPELEALCDALVADGIIPFALANQKMWPASWYYAMLVDRLGGTEVIENAAARSEGVTFESEAFTAAGEKLMEWIDKGYFPDGFNGLDHSAGDDRQLFYAGAAAMWSYPSGVQFLYSENPEMIETVGVSNFPWAEEAGVGTNAVCGSVGSTYCCIPTTTQNVDAAWEFLTLFMDDVYLGGTRAAGFNPPTKDYADYVEIDLQKEVFAISDTASSVQLAWDQLLAAELGILHKEALQAMMGKSISVAEYNAQMEALSVELASK